MAEIIDSNETDKDTVEEDVLQNLFTSNVLLVFDKAVSLAKSFINNLHGSKSLKIAISLTDNTLQVYDIGAAQVDRVCKLSGHSKNVTDVAFSPDNDSLVYSSSLDGLIKLWDIRASGSCVQEYKDLLYPLESFDVSCNGKVLCGGSQLVEDDAFLIFWDQRQPIPLGGYWNSHTDDITQVRFHREKSQTLATGSTDGLINIFDITEQTEDDALTYSLNVENSVEKLSWLDSKRVSCITQSSDLQIWDTERGDLLQKFAREKVAHSIKRSKEDDCYLVDTYGSIDDTPKLLAGSHGANGDCLRSVTIKEKKLVPCTNFKENKQIVRCCWYNKENDLLVTAGESGIISIWRHGEESVNNTSKLVKSTKKLHIGRKKPY